MHHFLSFISSLFYCSYLAVSDLSELTFLSGGEMHMHPVHPPPPPPRVRACDGKVIAGEEAVSKQHRIEPQKAYL